MFLSDLAKVIIFALSLFGSTSQTWAIAGGHNTTIKRHQWQLSLQQNEKHICGAALIGRNWALTAAHCVKNNNTEFRVRAGSIFHSKGGQVFDVINVVVHPDFDEKTSNADIALLEFHENITTVAKLIPASLAYLTKELDDYTPVTITGWGQTANESSSETLQMIQIPYVSRKRCQAIFPDEDMTVEEFCAGYIGVGIRTACQGDFGGPGVSQARLHGIMSYVKECGNSNWPTMFTRIVPFNRWIEDVSGIQAVSVSSASMKNL